MNREKARERATELVSKMSVEEMASQLKFDSEAIERLDIPAYNWWNEGLHGVARAGVATMFPQAIGMAATFDTELLEKMGDCVAVEGRAKYNAARRYGDRDIYKGITFWSPNVNIFRDPRWGRGHETYGEDPYLTGQLGVSYIRGVQGEGEYMKAAACAKHMAAHSGPEEKRHYFDTIVSEKDLEETYLPAFEACVKDGQVEAVMGAYSRVNGEPSCAHKHLMQDILRDRWGFDGHFVSDCWAVKDFHESHRVTSRPEESVKLALETGCDLNCGCTYQKVMNAYHEGLIDEAVIRESCIRVYTTRFLLGMFDETEYDKISYDVIECDEHLALSERAAEESVVLLKNDGTLPLDISKIKTIGVIGPNANSRKALVGNYHGTASRYVTVLEGIQDFVEGKTRVYYAEGSHLFEDNLENLSSPDGGDGLAEAKAVAEISDVVVLVVGLDETLEGEQGDTGNSAASGDKADLNFPRSQERLMRAVLDMNKPVVVVNLTGSAMDLSLADEKACAVLQGWYPGARGGEAIARILFGEVSPSAKLPVTFYRDLKGFPLFDDYSMKNRTYRYYTGEALYPFGYGLTYGDVEVENLNVEKRMDDGQFDGIKVTVKVSNKGRQTDEVVQIYVHGEDDECAVLHPTLCGFERVSLDSGESKEVIIYIDKTAFTSVDEAGTRDIRSKSFSVYGGLSQPDERSEKLTGKKCLKAKIEL